MSTTTALDRARAAKRAKQDAGEQIKVLNPEEKLATKPHSLRLSISARCYQCEGSGADPGWKWRIGNCPVTDCALHTVRPYRAMNGTPRPKSLQ